MGAGTGGGGGGWVFHAFKNLCREGGRGMRGGGGFSLLYYMSAARHRFLKSQLIFALCLVSFVCVCVLISVHFDLSFYIL